MRLLCLTLPARSQWLDFTDISSTNLTLSSVAFSDDEEKDTGDAGIEDDAGCPSVESFSGVSEPCKEDEQCEEYDADFCLVDPATNQGGCVLTGCDSFTCPCEFACCDCSVFGYPIFCAPDEAVPELESYSCQCD